VFATLHRFRRALGASLIAFSTAAMAKPPSSVPLQVGPEPIVLTIERGTAAPDGRSRPVMTITGTVPGPIIRAKENEIIRVQVVNKMEVPTTLHCHGMQQIGTN
jgi:FtsP/CotA-like multicopper oxidase with cupredoxin domain